MKKHTEEQLQEIMKKYNTTREDALTAPYGILELFSDKPLSEKDSAYAKEIADSWLIKKIDNS